MPVLRGGSIRISNAHILTMNDEAPTARAIVIHDGVIDYVGSDEGALHADRGIDTHIDAKGRTLIPGFNDAHGHFIHDGIMALRCDLSGCANVQEAYARIKSHAATIPEREVVIAEKFDESSWPERAFPTREGLDKAAGGRAVLARRIDGHVAVASTGLLALYDERWTGDWDGINRETGVLLEEPSLNFNLVCPSPMSELLDGLDRFLAKAPTLGVTSAQDYTNPQYWRAWQQCRRSRERDGRDLGLRVDASTYVDHLDDYVGAGIETGTGDDWLAVGGVKIFADGSMGGWSAYLREPYVDKPDTRGLRTYDDTTIQGFVRKAHDAGLQLRMHVIGDGAVEQGTLAFESLAEGVGVEPVRAMRHRFEHYEMSDRPLRDRAKALGIVLSMQPNFVGAWSRFEGLYGQRLGDRHHLMNPTREILDEGHKVAFGSDCMPFGPLVGIRGIVNAPYDHMRITLTEALRGYTLGAAYGQHREHVKGSLSPGMLGDVVLLDHDLSAAAADGRDIVDALGISLTVTDGLVRYSTDPTV